MTNSATSLGFVSTNWAPNSCSQVRIASRATSASDIDMFRANVRADLADVSQIIDSHRVLQCPGHIPAGLERVAGSIVHRMPPRFAERCEAGA